MTPFRRSAAILWMSGCVTFSGFSPLQAVEPASALQQAMGIPLSIAQIVDSYQPDPGTLPEIILIQDIHRHPEAQNHIAAVLLYGSRHWGLRNVYLEGAEANHEVIKPSFSSRTEMREALYAGQIGGPEMAAALLEPSELSLQGMEESTLYKEHVQIYEEVEGLRSAALRELSMSRLFQTGLDVSPSRLDPYEQTQRLLRLRMKPMDYAVYLQQPSVDRQESVLSQAMRAAELFYVLADERSRVFTDVLLASSSKEPRAAVVGGFHTEWMTQELKRQGRSFVVLSPQVTTTGYEGLYAKGMQQTISALKVRPPL